MDRGDHQRSDGVKVENLVAPQAKGVISGSATREPGIHNHTGIMDPGLRQWAHPE